MGCNWFEQHADLQKYFDALLAIGHHPARLEAALANTATNLRSTSAEIGNVLAMQKG